jgi:hypothetical protein
MWSAPGGGRQATLGTERGTRTISFILCVRKQIILPFGALPLSGRNSAWLRRIMAVRLRLGIAIAAARDAADELDLIAAGAPFAGGSATARA